MGPVRRIRASSMRGDGMTEGSTRRCKNMNVCSRQTAMETSDQFAEHPELLQFDDVLAVRDITLSNTIVFVVRRLARRQQ